MEAAFTALGVIVAALFTWWAKRGDTHVDSGELALEIAKETRQEVKEARAESNWLRGALTIALDHAEDVWQWAADGSPPPPPPRRPSLPPWPPGMQK